MPGIQQFEQAVALGESLGGGRLTMEAAELLCGKIGTAAEPLSGMGAKSLEVPNWSISRHDAERLLSEAPITFAERKGEELPSELRAGYIIDGGAVRPVFARDLRAFGVGDRAERELKAYAVQKRSPFTTLAPVAVSREDEGLLVQERVGRALNLTTRLVDKRLFGIEAPDESKFADYFDYHEAKQHAFQRSPSLKLMLQSPRFYDQVEQSIVERGVIGDTDGQPWNIAISSRKGSLFASNLDWECAFDDETVPDIPKLAAFRGKQISTSTLSKLDQFVDTYKTADGRSYLAHSGLTQSDTANMLTRARWYLDNGKFRGSSVY